MVEVNPYEARILTVMLKSRYSLTTGAIADRSGISWNTADKYLREMEEKGWVRKRLGYWKVIVSEDYLEE